MLHKLKNKTALVTGCAGFIPSYVAEHLLQHGVKVIGIDDMSTGNHSNMSTFSGNPNFTFINGDVCNRELINEYVSKVDYIYHGAIRGIGVSVKDPITELRVNTESTLLILEAIREHRIERFVYPSSASVYGNQKKMPESEDDNTHPLSPYGVSKLAAEKYCMVYHHMFKVPVVALRYFNTYGPRQRKDSTYGGVVSIFINNAIQGKALSIYGDGEQTRDFTYIEDNLSATLQAFVTPDIEGQVINISGGKEYTVNHLAELIKQISKKTDLPIEHIGKRAIDNIDRRFGDIARAKELLKYNPSTPLEKGLRATYDWNKKNQNL